MTRPLTLVTGATGYIGGRLVPRLLEQGHRIRCMTRDPGRLSLDPWRDQVEVVRGDVLDPATLAAALDGCDFAYYLVHSMGHADDFGEVDRTGAENFRKAADNAGLERIVYLGGLGRTDERLSKHLASRQEVGRILASGSTPVTEVRAAVIIGAGSVSFEMLRYLTEVLPVMTTPKWVRTRCQPIAIRSVLEILTGVLEDEPVSRVLEVGGPEILSYEEMMQIYAEEAGLRRRLIIPVPVLSPGLSSRWIGLVTPLPVGVARPLVDSLKNEVIVTDDTARRLFPHEQIEYREAVRRALDRTTSREVETRWSDAATSPALPLPTDPSWSGGARFEDRRIVHSDAAAEKVFWAFTRIGGEVGYYGFQWAWQLRGLLDSIVGGVGLRRGRRHPEDLRPGEALDFWRVREVEPGSRLLLEAEMKLPGDAWLEWTAEPDGTGSKLTQTATFVPRGLLGRLYWFSLVPFHNPIFGNMARRIASAAEDRRAEVAR
jgi:uncharacterized protein YbjT (DUF2867 family)